jgi:hypothetical protein
MNFEKSKLEYCHAAIEVRGSTFNLRNVYEEETGFTNIEILDEDGKFVDEFASGFGFDLEDEPAEVELVAVKVFEYIDENIVF